MTAPSMYVKVVEQIDCDDFMELPLENDGTLLLSTLKAQFPDAIGLKYKSETGGWRGIKLANDLLHPPHEGWEDKTLVVTIANSLKRKTTISEDSHHSSKSRRPDILDDLIVLGVPYTTTEEEFKKYFTENCGELLFSELKYEKDSKKSRGFGFIRFKTEDGANEALNKNHCLEGRNLEIRMSKKRDNAPTKLFIGRLPSDTTDGDLKDYFSNFGEIVDIFVPNPFRGFGFVTYSSQEEAIDVLNGTHKIKGSILNVTAAEPKGPKISVNPSKNNFNNYGSWDGRTPGNLYHQSSSLKLFVGRLPHGTTEQELNHYFSSLGVLTDVFVPNPPRGFGFVTFASQEVVSRVLRMIHTLHGAQLNVTLAEPKEKTSVVIPVDNNSSNYSWDPNTANPAGWSSHFAYNSSGSKDVASEIKDMLCTLIATRK